MKNTYWNGEGKLQRTYAILVSRIPIEGEVIDKPSLEKLRKAANCYYDLYNNGLCNRAAEFRQVFGFAGTALRGKSDKRLEDKMTEIILNAAIEQGLIS